MDERESTPSTATDHESIEFFDVVESPTVQLPSKVDSNSQSDTSAISISYNQFTEIPSCVSSEIEKPGSVNPGFEADYDDCNTRSTEHRLRCMVKEANKDITARFLEWTQTELEKVQVSLTETLRVSLELLEEDMHKASVSASAIIEEKIHGISVKMREICRIIEDEFGVTKSSLSTMYDDLKVIEANQAGLQSLNHQLQCSVAWCVATYQQLVRTLAPAYETNTIIQGIIDR